MPHNIAARALALASVINLLSRGRAWFAGAVADATIDGHRQRQGELVESCQAIIAQADAEKRDLSSEEQGQIEANNAEVDRLERQIEIRERTIANAARLASPGRATAPDALVQGEDDDAPVRPTAAAARPAPEPARRPSVPAQPRATAAGTAGFRSLGDFARAVVAARSGQIDQRLTNAAASSITQEGVGPDGGFAVPSDFRQEIMTRVFGEDSLISRTDFQTASGNTWTAPVDETTAWGTGGIKAFWTAETVAMTQSRPSLRSATVRLEKLACLVPITEEMLDDAPAMDRYLRSKMPMAIDWETSLAIVRGTGVGQPLGFMNSPALVTVLKESGQAANTLVAANVAKMYARMPVRSRSSAIWLVHPDVEPLLYTMSISNQPIYLPPGGFSQSPFGLLMGRPVMPHQACSALSALGDIIFFDPMQYLTVGKAGGVRVETSMHLWFDQDIQAFKATLRLAGQPWWASAAANRAGGTSLGPYVTLEAR